MPTNADLAAIKKAYRQLALNHHPDRVKGDAKDVKATEERFKQIGHAYSILSDETTRRDYDKQVQSGGGYKCKFQMTMYQAMKQFNKVFPRTFS